jgi:hypothetical protein
VFSLENELLIEFTYYQLSELVDSPFFPAPPLLVLVTPTLMTPLCFYSVLKPAEVSCECKPSSFPWNPFFLLAEFMFEVLGWGRELWKHEVVL